jgi:hypothetical protein
MGSSDFSRVQGSANVFLVPKHVEIKPSPRNTPPQDIVVPRMGISAIPSAMRQMGWNVAAALMERWFASPGWAMPEDWKQRGEQPPATQIPGPYLDTRIVSMDWAVKYIRARAAIYTLMEKATTAPTIQQLKNRLTKSGRYGGEALQLGHQGMSAVQLDDMCQVNYQAFGDSWDVMDDMYGALGKATMKMAFVGRSVRDGTTGRHKFHVALIGFYIRDYYDFNGDQPLGIWTESGILNKSEMVANVFLDGLAFDWHGEPIGKASNQSFRTFRERTGRGGDFVLYSDVLWKEVDMTLDLS